MESSQKDPSSASSASEHDSGSRARVLVTDDRPQMLLAVEAALGSLHECSFAASVDEAR